jgi:hypothetical protein
MLLCSPALSHLRDRFTPTCFCECNQAGDPSGSSISSQARRILRNVWNGYMKHRRAREVRRISETAPGGQRTEPVGTGSSIDARHTDACACIYAANMLSVCSEHYRRRRDFLEKCAEHLILSYQAINILPSDKWRASISVISIASQRVRPRSGI